MSSRRQRSIPLGGHYRQVSLYLLWDTNRHVKYMYTINLLLMTHRVIYSTWQLMVMTSERRIVYMRSSASIRTQIRILRDMASNSGLIILLKPAMPPLKLKYLKDTYHDFLEFAQLSVYTSRSISNMTASFCDKEKIIYRNAYQSTH